MMTTQNLISLRMIRPLTALACVGLCFVLLGNQAQPSQPLSAGMIEYQAHSLPIETSAQSKPTYLLGTELSHGGNTIFKVKGAEVHPYL